MSGYPYLGDDGSLTVLRKVIFGGLVAGVIIVFTTHIWETGGTGPATLFFFLSCLSYLVLVLLIKPLNPWRKPNNGTGNKYENPKSHHPAPERPSASRRIQRLDPYKSGYVAPEKRTQRGPTRTSPVTSQDHAAARPGKTLVPGPTPTSSVTPQGPGTVRWTKAFPTFTAKAYPTIEIDSVQLENIVPGERTKIATVFIHVQGEPYAIQTQQLKAAIGTPFEQGCQSAVPHGTVAQGATGQALPVPASTPDRLGTIELEPQRLFGEGPAWEYDVFYTPKNEGIHNLVFELNMGYGGVLYSYASDSLTLRSLLPVVAVEPVVAKAPPTVVTSPEITQPKPISMGDSFRRGDTSSVTPQDRVPLKCDYGWKVTPTETPTNPTEPQPSQRHKSSGLQPLGLSPGTIKKLSAARIQTPEELQDKSDEQLRAIYGIGQKTLSDIRASLSGHWRRTDGVRWCTDPDCRKRHGPSCCIRPETKAVCGRRTNWGETFHQYCMRRKRREITRTEHELERRGLTRESAVEKTRDLEESLGVDPGWSTKKKKKHLMDQIDMWNSREVYGARESLMREAREKSTQLKELDALLDFQLVQTLGLSTPCKKMLSAAGKHFAEELREMADNELRDIPGIGESRLSEIRFHTGGSVESRQFDWTNLPEIVNL